MLAEESQWELSVQHWGGKVQCVLRKRAKDKSLSRFKRGWAERMWKW